MKPGPKKNYWFPIKTNEFDISPNGQKNRSKFYDVYICIYNNIEDY